MIHDALDRLLPARRRRRLEALRDVDKPRSIRIHSISDQPEERTPGQAARWHRVAFEFLDPPGPWSMQFYEAASGQDALDGLEPGVEARYFESRDGARLRLIETTDGEAIWPR